MQDIKFRADIPKRNATIIFTLEDLIMAHLQKELFSIREILIPWLLSGNIPDRYTGQKDNNGVEIYEGDIIIKPANRNRYLEVVFADDIACFEAVHSVGARALSGYVNSDGGVLIIGNRCKNPELLEESKEDKQSLGTVLKAAPVVPWPSKEYLQSIKKIKDWGGDARTPQH